MFISNKRKIVYPEHIEIQNNQVQVVIQFRLLGITIDYKLSFDKHVGELKQVINKRLFSIHRLFYLSPKVKLQFFKSFILPHFDYCSTLFIYFSKRAIQKLANCYNFFFFKLFKITHQINSAEDYNTLNNRLSQLNI